MKAEEPCLCVGHVIKKGLNLKEAGDQWVNISYRSDTDCYITRNLPIGKFATWASLQWQYLCAGKFANLAIFTKFAKISCTRIFPVLQYSSLCFLFLREGEILNYTLLQKKYIFFKYNEFTMVHFWVRFSWLHLTRVRCSVWFGWVSAHTDTMTWCH